MPNDERIPNDKWQTSQPRLFGHSGFGIDSSIVIRHCPPPPILALRLEAGRPYAPARRE
jgi:hypothetical protein